MMMEDIVCSIYLTSDEKNVDSVCKECNKTIKSENTPDGPTCGEVLSRKKTLSEYLYQSTNTISSSLYYNYQPQVTNYYLKQ